MNPVVKGIIVLAHYMSVGWVTYITYQRGKSKAHIIIHTAPRLSIMGSLKGTRCIATSALHYSSGVGKISLSTWTKVQLDPTNGEDLKDIGVTCVILPKVHMLLRI